MKPTSLLVLMALTWALANFWLVPLVSQSWQAATLRGKVARAGSLAVLEKLRDLALIACITLLLVIALVALANRLAMSAFVAPAVLGAVESVYAVAKSWNEKYALVLTWITLSGLVLCLYLSAKNAKRRVVNVWSEKASEVFEELGRGDSIDKAREDEKLRPLVEALDAAIAEIEMLRGAAATESGREAIEQRRAGIGVLLNTLAVEIAAKDLDMDAALRTRVPEEKVGRSYWAKLRKILVSDQLAKDFGMLRKPMSYVLTGLMVVSLVGWTAEPMANSLQLAVNTLRVNLFSEETNRELQAVSARLPQDTADQQDENDPESTDDLPEARVVARMLAHAATNDLLRAQLLRTSAFDDGAPAAGIERRAATAAKADLVRAALIDTLPASVDSTVAASKVQVEAAADLADARTGTAADATAVFRSKVEEQILPRVEDLRRHDPGAFARLSRAAAVRYGNPISALDAQGKIVSEMLSRVFREIDATPTGEAAKQAQRLLKEFGEKSFNTWAIAAAKRYVSDAIVQAARPEVLARTSARTAGRFAFEAPGWVEGFAEQLQHVDGPNKQWSSSDAAAREARMMAGLRGAANDILDSADTGNPADRRMFEYARANVQSLQGYDALFPPEIGSIPGAGAGGGAGGASGARKPAMNFHRARVSFAVRGVIIGRELGGFGVDVDGLRWQVREGKSVPTRIKLDLLIDGGWRHLGTFDAAVVNQALRYAADRRVIATTIVPGDGKVIQRMTNTHPALIDTPLGCRVIEVDRFVDEVTRPGHVPTALSTLATDRDQMWRWLERVEVAHRVALSEVDDEETCIDALSDWATQKSPIRFSSAVSSSLAAFTGRLDGQHGGTTKWLASVDACAAATGTELTRCVCKEGMKTKIGSPYWYPEDHTSQVREQDARIDKDLAWLRRSPGHLGNLEFAVHTTFAVRNPENAEPIDEDRADAYDFPPAQIQALRGVLGAWIPGYVLGAGGDRMPVARSHEDFMAPLEDFVILQRLFRAGFSGQLGEEFPFARLLLLERETRPFVPRQPTVRWEIGKGVPQELFMDNLKKRNPDAEAAYRGWFVDRARRKATGTPVCDAVSK